MNKTVNICGIPYKIIDKECIEGNGRVCGEITYDECIIKMRAGMNPDYYNQTLIHEVVHGMLVMIGRNDLSDDEIFVQTLALAISQTFDLKGEKEE
jgi:hypothetical protein